MEKPSGIVHSFAQAMSQPPRKHRGLWEIARLAWQSASYVREVRQEMQAMRVGPRLELSATEVADPSAPRAEDDESWAKATAHAAEAGRIVFKKLIAPAA